MPTSVNQPASAVEDVPQGELICFHCGLPVPAGYDGAVSIHGRDQPMCCTGCRAVANAIVASGNEDFYRFRTGTSPTAAELIPEFLKEVQVWDNPAVQQGFVRSEGESIREASLILEGIVCAACVWLNERQLRGLDGVLDVQINYATRRARVRWDNRTIQLSGLLKAIAGIGYRAYPYDPDRRQALVERERKEYLRRLGVAGLLGMQVMMLAVALYAGDWSGMEGQFRELFAWVSLGLTTPVVLYSAQPFFRSALGDLRRGSPGMDVPVALGIAIAFAASTWSVVRGQGELYFDSVVMFVFFLLTARFLELLARKRANETVDRLAQHTPTTAARLVRSGGDRREEIVAAADLQQDDLVLMRPGDVVPADGRVVEGNSSTDEALITGESRPVRKEPGDGLIGGSVNMESPLVMVVERVGDETLLSSILQLLERAESEKPSIARVADRAAGWFVPVVLLLATGVAVFWWLNDPDRWLPVTIAVLVVTCPCALSLATPAALTAATGRLTALGLLVTRAHALEVLARASHFVFDKTGTLTDGRLSLVGTTTYTRLDEPECLRVAAALEGYSEHPVARALIAAAGANPSIQATEVVTQPGGGISGVVRGERYSLGNAAYVRAQAGTELDVPVPAGAESAGASIAYLAGGTRLLAAFVLGDRLRPGADKLIHTLSQGGRCSVILLTGDHAAAARRVGDALGVDEVDAELTPARKLQRVQALQQQGATVAMVGDGVNDAPVLAQAQVSIAMGGGTQLAKISADMVLLSDRLDTLGNGVRLARRTMRVIRQNLVWAAGYNLVALPLAAAGMVPPWAAAIGMSASSLLVVGNALRLTRGEEVRPD